MNDQGHSISSLPLSQDCPQPVIGVHEHLLTIPEAAEHLPLIESKRRSSVTIWRWCRRGIKGVRLEYIKVGKTMMTSVEALDRFYRALAQAEPALPGYQPVPRRYRPKYTAFRRRQIEESNRRLKEAGF